MPRSTPTVHVVGRFPPPLDGQAIATERLASLLEPAGTVGRVNVSAPEGDLAVADVRLRLGRVRHYAGMGAHARAALQAAPMAPVLWPSISSNVLGHARDLLTVVPAFQRRQPVFGVVHRGDFAALYRRPLTRTSGLALTRRLSGLVFLSHQLAADCAPWVPPAKRFVIPNTLATETTATAREARAKQERGPGRPLRLLYLSNMIPSKGYADVLKAVGILRDRGVAATADFAGRWTADADRRTFEQAVADWDLGDRVRHHGGVSQAQARALHLAADVFVLPTYYPVEAQPLTVIEALAAGTPVVVTPHASLPEMVRAGQEARFVPPRTPAAIADAVAQLLPAEAWRQASADARERFESAFAPPAVLERWLSLIRQVPPNGGVPGAE